ncbi:MAG: Rpn family recombination-promoting nuclease/putative transposase [Lachnospiraceae bacterium]|nr:Rpn family recombination-promoting nuclease/putative transposase [Lachnospiraceae bacterium]
MDLRNTLIVTKDETQYDLKAKRILARKSVLSHILAATVDEFKGMDVSEVAKHIEGEIYISSVPVESGLTNLGMTDAKGDRIVTLNTEDFDNNEGLVRFDILFYVRTKDGISQVIINVEAQKAKPSGYSLLNRVIYYVSRLISSQKERDFAGDNYDDIKRVYTVWICMNMDSCIWNYIHLANDALMGNYDWEGKLDMINIVLLGVPNELPEKGDGYELHRLLSTLFSPDLPPEERIDILQTEYDMAHEDALGKEMMEMCNLSEGIWERGIAEGEARGKKEGKKEGQMDVIQWLKDHPNSTAEQVMQAFGLA